MSINPLHPDLTAPAIIPPGHGATLPETVPLRKGILLELAAQHLYSDGERRGLGRASSQGAAMDLDCICTRDVRLQHCPNCVDFFMTLVHTRLRPGEGTTLQGFRLSKQNAELWPALAKVFNDGVQARRTWFGTPDRLDMSDGGLVGTEFKAGNARLEGAQRLLAEAWAELGVPIIVARLTAEDSQVPHRNQMCRIPRTGEETFGVIRTREDQSAEDIKFGDTSLVEYWRSRGENIDSTESVYGVEYYPRRRLSFYPESLVTPVRVRIERDELLEAVATPFPWHAFPDILAVITPRQEVCERRGELGGSESVRENPG